ncbi:hypothetical protein BSM4216_2715 [Bacillus smithii]|nr:hypothetical protein BSM4216_2715 [Bacillus smithii]
MICEAKKTGENEWDCQEQKRKEAQHSLLSFYVVKTAETRPCNFYNSRCGN